MLFRIELIGKKVMVDTRYGTIIDETKNLLIIKVGKKVKKFIKKNHVFKIEHNGYVYAVNGKKIVARPEERIKMKLK